MKHPVLSFALRMCTLAGILLCVTVLGAAVAGTCTLWAACGLFASGCFATVWSFRLEKRIARIRTSRRHLHNVASADCIRRTPAATPVPVQVA